MLGRQVICPSQPANQPTSVLYCRLSNFRFPKETFSKTARFSLRVILYENRGQFCKTVTQQSLLSHAYNLIIFLYKDWSKVNLYIIWKYLCMHFLVFRNSVCPKRKEFTTIYLWPSSLVGSLPHMANHY